MAEYWHKARRFLARKVLHTNDTPHAVALGTGIATFVALLPLIGFQTVIAVALAAVFRANKAICVPIVWITNPFTLVPIYGMCFKLGHVVRGRSAGHASTNVLSEFELQQSMSLFELGFWKDLFSRLVGYSVELWIGCAIIGVVFGIASYVTARWGVTTYRERRRRRLLRRGLLRATLEQGKIGRRTDVA